MLLFRSSFFLLILFLHCIALPQENRATTAGEVFFNYVDQHAEDVKEVMGATWRDDIFNHTASWTIDDTTGFLSSLESSEFPISFILRILKNTESLQRIEEQVNNFRFQTGSDVFIDYVKSYFREKLRESDPSLEGEGLEEALEDMMSRQMAHAPLWEECIRESAQDWSVLDAILFLDDLENKWDMDTDTIIKRLSATSFFRTTYLLFTSRLEVYTEYLGRASVKKVLHKGFTPFRKGLIENIRAMLDTVFTYFNFEKEILIETLSNNLTVISQNSLDLFHRKLDWLENFLGRGDRSEGKQEIKRIVREKRSLNIISFVGIKLNRKTGEYENETEFRINFLRGRGVYDQEDVIDLFKSNPQAFSRGDLDTDKITYLEYLLGVEDASGNKRNGEAELNWMLQNGGFHGIVEFKVYGTKKAFENKHVNFLRNRRFSSIQIADLFKSNPQAFSRGDLDADKIAYLEDLLEVEDVDSKIRDGKNELDWILQNKGFVGVIGFKLYKTRVGFENKYVKFLKSRGFSPLQIANLFKSNPQAFSMGDLDPAKIAYLEELLGVENESGKKQDGEAELNWVLENRSFAGVVGFKGSKRQENKYVKFLKNRGLTPLQIAELFKSNPEAFSRGDLDIDKIAYLEELLGVEDRRGKKQDGKAELNWVLQNGGFLGVLRFQGTKTQQNKYMKFLKDRNFSPLQIADLFKSNPRAFSEGDLDPAKIAYLEELLEVEDARGNKRDGETELNWVMENRSFEGIVRFKGFRTQENKYMKFLKARGLSPLQIADIFKSDPLAFSRGDLDTDKIAYLEEYLGKGNRRRGQQKLNQIILQKGGFRTLGLFDYNSDTQPANKIIDVLENVLHFDQGQVIQAMEGHFSKLFVEELTEEMSEEFLRSLMEKDPDICQKSLIK